jgi:hypothetical protein
MLLIIRDAEESSNTPCVAMPSNVIVIKEWEASATLDFLRLRTLPPMKALQI